MSDKKLKTFYLRQHEQKHLDKVGSVEGFVMPSDKGFDLHCAIIEKNSIRFHELISTADKNALQFRSYPYQETLAHTALAHQQIDIFKAIMNKVIDFDMDIEEESRAIVETELHKFSIIIDKKNPEKDRVFVTNKIITPEKIKQKVRYINAKSCTGSTLAHYAVVNKNKDILSLLRDYGADFTIQNQVGMNPLDLAMKFEKGISKREERCFGRPPMTREEKAERASIVAMLQSHAHKISMHAMPPIVTPTCEEDSAHKHKKQKNDEFDHIFALENCESLVLHDNYEIKKNEKSIDQTTLATGLCGALADMYVIM